MNIPGAGIDNAFETRGLKDIHTDRLRSGIKPALFSAAVPGIGQISKGESWRGMILVAFSALMMVFSILSYDVLRVSSPNTSVGYGMGLIVVAFLPYVTIWSYAVLDALLSKRIR